MKHSAVYRSYLTDVGMKLKLEKRNLVGERDAENISQGEVVSTRNFQLCFVSFLGFTYCHRIELVFVAIKFAQKATKNVKGYALY